MLRGRRAAPLDRRGTARDILKRAAFALIALLIAATGPASPPLAALRWTDPAQALDALTRTAPECLAPVAASQRASVEIGRAAFRAPQLLGGQAARLGLACESCHANGRDNPAFLFPGLSGAPGTADVTAPLMSAHRGDEIFDPRPIPDLARPGRIGRAPNDPALARFIRGLIVEEFDGREPPPAVLDGLVAYVRAIDARACPAHALEPLRADDAADTAVRAVAAARERLAAADADTARLMLGAARSALGRLDERYAALPSPRARLRSADARLLAIQRSLDSPGAKADRAMSRWLAGSRRWRQPLARDESRSLYSREVLSRAMARGGLPSARASANRAPFNRHGFDESPGYLGLPGRF